MVLVNNVSGILAGKRENPSGWQSVYVTPPGQALGNKKSIEKREVAGLRVQPTNLYKSHFLETVWATGELKEVLSAANPKKMMAKLLKLSEKHGMSKRAVELGTEPSCSDTVKFLEDREKKIDELFEEYKVQEKAKESGQEAQLKTLRNMLSFHRVKIYRPTLTKAKGLKYFKGLLEANPEFLKPLRDVTRDEKDCLENLKKRIGFTKIADLKDFLRKIDVVSLKLVKNFPNIFQPIVLKIKEIAFKIASVHKDMDLNAYGGVADAEAKLLKRLVEILAKLAYGAEPEKLAFVHSNLSDKDAALDLAGESLNTLAKEMTELLMKAEGKIIAEEEAKKSEFKEAFQQRMSASSYPFLKRASVTK